MFASRAARPITGIRRPSKVKCDQSPVDPLGILRHGSDEHVEILGGAGVSMKRDRVSPQYDELRPRIRKLDQQIAEILRQLDQVGPPGTKRTGISDLE